MLLERDPLPAPPQRVLVAGTSGSGKSTLAAHIADAAGLPYVELDSLFHGPGWSPRPEFDAEVAALASADRWATEWQYGTARPVLAARADLMVWLDLPRRVVMRRVVGRTIRRRVRNEELWNGNHEAALRTVLTDRDHIVRWAWRTHGLTAMRIAELAATRPELPIVRLRSAAAVERWTSGPLAAAVRG
ncbi:AAA family ATPase [Agromyces aurantiacus]|uniref:AAA family ATPase n=1 Tax=Agromyces aurantiacus TaxID=165814 RepID=A0ABV9R8F0_9MICO|nr:AAA family ATPase [Agromyces aurantiacus]MBM7504660.1 adenylate kinase family enzyme [Agromyces aurantiacus]